MMKKAVIALGTNIGSRIENLQHAVSSLSLLPNTVHVGNYFVFSCAVPFFDLLFPLYCGLHIVCCFIIDQFVDLVFCGEAFGIHVMLMLVYTLCKIAGDTGVDHCVGTVGKDVYIGLHNELLCGERIATASVSTGFAMTPLWGVWGDTDCHTSLRTGSQ